MLGYLKRLVTTGAAYQFGDIVAKGLALLTLPLYTHHLSPEAYGAALQAGSPAGRETPHHAVDRRR